MKTTKATCPYCGVGCGVLIESDGSRITGVKGDPDHPANFGRLCTKGSTLHLTAKPDGRALFPETRRKRSAPRQRESWDTTTAFIAQRFAECIQTHGPDSVGFYISGQLLTEDYYAFNKLAKGLRKTARQPAPHRGLTKAHAGPAGRRHRQSAPSCGKSRSRRTARRGPPSRPWRRHRFPGRPAGQVGAHSIADRRFRLVGDHVGHGQDKDVAVGPNEL